MDPSLKSQIQALRGRGQPLPHSARDYFEPRFRRDFGQVRIHTDQQASDTARLIHARAFTFGQDVIFNSDQFRPSSDAGKRLLAHELTHTIQQSASAGVQIQKVPENEESGPDNELLPEPSDQETFVVGNSIDIIKTDSPADQLFENPELSPKTPAGKGKTKMSGPLGPVQEGLGITTGKSSAACAKWIKLTRATYPYDPRKGADKMEKELIKTYKGYKEGVPIQKPADFNKKLKAATKNPCTCIENIQIDGHGGSWSGGAQEFAPRKYKQLGKRSFGIKKKKGGKLVPYNFKIFNGIQFCRPCTITLGGCYVALNKPKAGKSGFKGAGDALGKALAAKTGCSVKAYTGLTRTFKAGVFKGDPGGKWVTTKPKQERK